MGELPSWAVQGALGLLALELSAIMLTGLVGPVVGIGIVVLPLFILLCWISLPTAWLVTLAVVPFSFEMVFPIGSSALWLPTEPMVFVFLAVWIVRASLHGAYSIPRSPVLVSLAVLAILAILSSFGSRNLFFSVKAIMSTAWLAAFGFFFPLLYGGEKRFARRALIVLAVAGSCAAIYGLFFLVRHGIARWSANAMGRPFFPEHGTYSVFETFALAALLALSLSVRRARWKWLGFGAAGLVTLAIVLSLARAAFLGLAAVLVTTLWHLMQARKVRTVLVIVVLTACVGVGIARFRAGAFVGLYVASIAQPGELSNLERISRWLAAWNMVRAHPLLGIGYGNYEDTYYSYRVLTLNTEERFRRMGVHSEYLRILAEMGWLGFGACMTFLALVFRQGSAAIGRARSPTDRAMAIGALAGFASYLLHGVFNYYGESDKVMIPFWFFVAFISILWSRTRGPDPTPAHGT
jgi:O-antigen ligase